MLQVLPPWHPAYSEQWQQRRFFLETDLYVSFPCCKVQTIKGHPSPCVLAPASLSWGPAPALELCRAPQTHRLSPAPSPGTCFSPQVNSRGACVGRRL